MRSHWITHKGKKIFYADYSNFKLEGLKEETAEVAPVLCKEPLNSVLVLTDVRGTYGTPDIVEHLKKLASKTQPHVHKRAVIGVTGVQTILLKAINKFSGKETVPFDTVEEGLDWLVGE